MRTIAETAYRLLNQQLRCENCKHIVCTDSSCMPVKLYCQRLDIKDIAFDFFCADFDDYTGDAKIADRIIEAVECNV